MPDLHVGEQSRRASGQRWPSDGPVSRLPKPLRLTHLCGLGSLCLSRSCLIMRYLPMRMSGLDTFMPFREMLWAKSREGSVCGHQGGKFPSTKTYGVNPQPK